VSELIEWDEWKAAQCGEERRRIQLGGSLKMVILSHAAFYWYRNRAHLLFFRPMPRAVWHDGLKPLLLQVLVLLPLFFA
jgi:hypothetical protein